MQRRHVIQTSVLVASVLLIAASAVALLTTQITIPSKGSFEGVDSLNQDYSYLIYKEGSTYHMKNGTTGQNDWSSTNPLTIIQASIDNVAAIEFGGNIFLKAANYSINGMIQMENDVTLILEDGTLINQEKSSWTESFGTVEGTFMFNGSDIDNPIKNARITSTGRAKIRGEGSARGEEIFFFRYAKHCSVENLELYNTGSQIMFFQRTNYSRFSNLYVHNYSLDVTDNGKAFYALGGLYNCEFLNIHINSAGIGGTGSGGFLIGSQPGQHCRYNKFINIFCENYPDSSHAIYLASGTSGGVVSNNIVIGTSENYANGVQMNSASHNIIDWTAYGGTAFSLADGAADSGSFGNIIKGTSYNYSAGAAHIFMQAGKNISHNKVTVIAENCGTGIWFNEAAECAGYFEYNEFHVIAKGCTEGIEFVNLDSDTIVQYNTFYCQLESCTTGIDFSSEYVKYNKFYGNFGSISGTVPATNTFEGMIEGKHTHNSGTATISASTSVTFDHDLAGAADFVSASFDNTGWTSWKWSSTSTQITITVETSGTYEVYWYAIYKP